MIQRLCEQQSAISAALHRHRDLLHLEHSPEEWRLLEDLCELLEPFKDATTYLSASQYPSLSAPGPLLAQIRKKLVSDPNHTCSAAIHAVKQAIASDLDTRHQNSDICMLMHKCTLLDPRLKSLAHLREEQQEAMVNSIVNEIVAECIQSTHQPSTSSESIDSGNPEPPRTKKCALEKLLGSTFSSVNPDSSFSVSLNELVRTELSCYKSEPVLGLKEKPLEWWRLHHQSYPNLAKVARKYLGVVATSVPSERLFSTAGKPVNTKRSALDPENIEKLVFLHDNLPAVCLPYKRAHN